MMSHPPSESERESSKFGILRTCTRLAQRHVIFVLVVCVQPHRRHVHFCLPGLTKSRTYFFQAKCNNEKLPGFVFGSKV